MKGKKGKSHSVLVKPKGGGEPAANLPGVEVMHEAKKGSHGFKDGGKVEQEAEESMKKGGRLDKKARKARGGGVTLRGRSPLSSAASTTMPGGSTTH